MRWPTLICWIVAGLCVAAGVVFLALGSISGIAMFVNGGVFALDAFSFRRTGTGRRIRQPRPETDPAFWTRNA